MLKCCQFKKKFYVKKGLYLNISHRKRTSTEIDSHRQIPHLSCKNEWWPLFLYRISSIQFVSFIWQKCSRSVRQTKKKKEQNATWIKVAK